MWVIRVGGVDIGKCITLPPNKRCAAKENQDDRTGTAKMRKGEIAKEMAAILSHFAFSRSKNPGNASRWHPRSFGLLSPGRQPRNGGACACSA